MHFCRSKNYNSDLYSHDVTLGSRLSCIVSLQSASTDAGDFFWDCLRKLCCFPPAVVGDLFSGRTSLTSSSNFWRLCSFLIATWAASNCWRTVPGRLHGTSVSGLSRSMMRIFACCSESLFLCSFTAYSMNSFWVSSSSCAFALVDFVGVIVSICSVVSSGSNSVWSGNSTTY